jgi:hypothetical protein
VFSAFVGEAIVAVHPQRLLARSLAQIPPNLTVQPACSGKYVLHGRGQAVDTCEVTGSRVKWQEGEVEGPGGNPTV